MNSPVPNRNEIANRAYAARLMFVLTELDIAKTFASLALCWCRRSKLSWSANLRQRNEKLARTAYESAIRFIPRVGVSAADAEQLAAKQQQVEAALEQLDTHDTTPPGIAS